MRHNLNISWRSSILFVILLSIKLTTYYKIAKVYSKKKLGSSVRSFKTFIIGTLGQLEINTLDAYLKSKYLIDRLKINNSQRTSDVTRLV